ncbi:GlcG/HbpS family heme-binding protein [Verrucomicrobiota bacterium sgz303538]
MKLRTALGIFICAALQALYANPKQLSREEVEQILAQAATQASRTNRNAIIAVTDAEGFVLGVWDVAGRLPNPLPPLAFKGKPLKIYGQIAGAISRAGTATFLSSDQNAFTSRTAGYIIQQHFPVGVRNTPPGPLVGVGFSNLFFSDINRFKQIPPGFNPALLSPPTFSPGVRGNPVPFTSLNDSPGGVPLYKSGTLVGGVGVVGDNDPTNLAPAAAIFAGFTQRSATLGFKAGRDKDEEVALAGQTGFRPPNEILATNVLIGGIRIPYVYPRPEDIRDVEDVQPLGQFGNAVAGYDVQESPPPYPFEIEHLGGIEGEVRIPFRDDPQPGKIGDAKRLTKDEVRGIINEAAARCAITRAGIRLPLGVRANVWIVVVNNPNQNGVPPDVLGTFRVENAPMFSWDVATQKARTAVFFSNRQLAMSTRTVGFLAQRYYPPGLDGRPHGPLFGFQEAVSLRLREKNPLKPPNPNLPNGITIFPGGFPIYRNGYLVGAVGVSGDGVDQDDIIGASGCKDFLPVQEIRADQYIYRGARLPYAKFPRDPVQ